jgi:thiamine-monophosphate kinase
MNLQPGRKPQVLRDLGEFRLLNEVILPELGRSSVELGDDCGFLPLRGSSTSVVVTTDFAPKPLAWLLGEQSYRTWGWYAVLINASDLAAAGAQALGFTSSVEGPADMLVRDMQDFYAGIADACAAYELPYAGGNIRAAPRFECHGTAFGTIPTAQRLGRSKCMPGDVFVSIGPCGEFIAAFLHARIDGIANLSDTERQLLLRPRPRLREMKVLRERELVSAASDNSDGVLGSLWNIAERSNCGVNLDFDESVITDSVKLSAARARLSPWNLFFFWGDWQVIAAVKSARMAEFAKTATTEAIPYVRLGVAIDGPTRLVRQVEGAEQAVRLLRNENFSASSFNESVEAHVDQMLSENLLNMTFA